eukprot:Lankesteria_metandrocarpae@DN2444_c0_g1_i3.p1
MVYDTLRFDSDCWDDIYKSGDYVKEWLPNIQWEDIRVLFQRVQRGNGSVVNVNSTEHKYLVAGCGKSQLSRNIFDCEGQPCVVSIDISETLVKNTVMDVRKMDFQNEVFDYVIDKATFDCMMCSNMRDSDVPLYLTEVFRVLKKGGWFVIMGFTHPQRCSRWIEMFEWDLIVEDLVFEEIAARPDQRNTHKEYFVMFLHKR